MRPRETPEIRRRPDGGIDTTRHLRIAREERSRRAHEMAKEALYGWRRLSTRLRLFHALRN